MRLLPMIVLGGAVTLSAPRTAWSDVVYDNAPNLTGGQIGDCVYNTTCGPDFNGVGSNTYGAQQFTFATGETVNEIDWNAIVNATTATSANWAFYADNAGAPGSQVASGSALSLSSAAGPVGDVEATTEYSMTISPVTLAAGTYYVAIQAVNTDFDDYLSLGVDSNGAFETTDGGTTWSAGYGTGNFPSIAISLLSSDSVSLPEPGSLAVFGLGLTGLAALRRRPRG